jgi:hypothetical protein
MKLTKLTTALAALAAAAVLGTSAQAQVFTAYSSGDALLGFEQAGNASDYVVDLGSVSQFITATTPLTFQLSTTDLSSVFGSTWSSNSQTNLVQWGLVANDQGQTISSDTDGNSIWYTKGETTSGTRTTAPIRGSASALANVSNAIQNLDTGNGGYDSELSTANANNAIIQAASAGNSWSSFKPGVADGQVAFGIGTDIEQASTGATGPTDSVLDFYEVDTKTGSNQPATFLGTFDLSNTGLLTFDPADTLAVPEPSAYALGITALVLFGVLKRRKAIQA